jgi:hypothetical protein
VPVLELSDFLSLKGRILDVVYYLQGYKAGPRSPSFKGGFFGFFLLMYVIQHCFICRPSDSTVSEDAGIEPRSVATLAISIDKQTL